MNKTTPINAPPNMEPFNANITDVEVETMIHHMNHLADRDCMPRRRMAVLLRVVAEKLLETHGIQVQKIAPPEAKQ